MQRDTTLQFWDEYHNENDSQEWISKPGEELLAMIFHHYWNQDQDHRHTSNIQVNNNNNNNNNDALTNDIVKNNDEIIKLLEIGCGTSTLVRDMKIHIENTYYYPRIIKKVIACGTDVSQVCIDVNQQRDGHNSGDLWYEVLNCLEDNNGNDDNGEQLSSSLLLSSSSFHHRGNWDLIIDKGCLDTFMFRSKKQGTNRIYPESVRKLLDNIHGWLSSSTKSSSSSSLSTSLSTSLSDDGGERLEKEEEKEEVVVRNRRVGCYIFISPRSKVKAVRDYAGFSSVRRYPLPGNYRAELEGKKNNINNRSNTNNNNNENNSNNENNNNITRDNVDDSNITSPPSSTPGYLFVCTKNINYKVGIEEPFPTAAATDHHGGDQNEKLNDDTKCPKCGISFLEFRKGEGVEFRGNKFWTRTFKGHCIHCN